MAAYPPQTYPQGEGSPYGGFSGGGRFFNQSEVMGESPGQAGYESPYFMPEQFFGEYGRRRRVYEQRFGDILGGFGQRAELRKGMGETAAQDIERQFQGVSTRAQQDLTSRGLTGTTVAPTVQAGITRAKSQEQQRLAEQLRAESISDIAAEQSFRERFNPPEMDLGLLAGLLGRGGGGGGGGTGIKPTGRGGQGIGPAPQMMAGTGNRNVAASQSPTGKGFVASNEEIRGMVGRGELSNLPSMGEGYNPKMPYGANPTGAQAAAQAEAVRRYQGEAQRFKDTGAAYRQAQYQRFGASFS